MTILDQWETEAEELLSKLGDWRDRRIITLISIVRKQQFALEEFREQSVAHDDNSLSSKWIEQLASGTLAEVEKMLNFEKWEKK